MKTEIDKRDRVTLLPATFSLFALPDHRVLEVFAPKPTNNLNLFSLLVEFIYPENQLVVDGLNVE